ncbi:MAG: hypothetical protein LBG59_05290 [Candidatus Peribacteria bacterium]|jgi:hypothetical protein|nr:hypothetical protein [Candidatus Peribacteria bacterium]
MLAIAAELEVPLNKLGTPFIVITSPSGESIPLVGADEALEHFKTLEEEIKTLTNTIETNQ